MPSQLESGFPTGTVAFRFVIEGQPPSWNASYRIVRVPHRGGGSHQQMAKTLVAEQYQMLLVKPAARRAKPPNWKPQGQVRVMYWIRLGRGMDADNALKLLNDGIAAGLEVDDKLFLPCVQELTSGHKQPHVEIEVSG
jgi:hypothetical protein